MFPTVIGWIPRYSTYREGLDQIVAAWKAENFLGNGRGE